MGITMFCGMIGFVREELKNDENEIIRGVFFLLLYFDDQKEVF